MIRFDRVTKVFGHGSTAVRAVQELSFDCPRGAFWALMGPSGSGKSTILHLTAGLTSPTSGSVQVDGAEVGAMGPSASALLRRRRLGYVLQTFDLLPFLTARANIAMPLVLDRVPKRESDARVDEALSLVGMSHRGAHDPSQLSGGEQQRVAVARALVIRPAVLLADEPTGNLDGQTGRTVVDLLFGMKRKSGATLVLVTHDERLAQQCERTIRMADGRIVADEQSVVAA